MVFRCINNRQVTWEVLKTAAFGLCFQHLPRDLANVNVCKSMFDLYIVWLTTPIFLGSLRSNHVHFINNIVTQKRPQSRSTALPNRRKKNRLWTNNEKTKRYSSKNSHINIGEKQQRNSLKVVSRNLNYYH